MAPSLPHLPARRVARLRRLLRVLQALSPALATRVALDLFVKPTRRELDAVDAPLRAAARRGRVAVGDSHVVTYEWGAGRPCVLLLHGWSSHAPRFSSFVGAITARGWRALAFDAPAHGSSPGRRATLPDFRLALDAVIAAAGPVDAVVAHSLGALATATRLADAAAAPPLAAAVLVSPPRHVGTLLETYLALLGADERFAARLREGFRRSPAGAAAAAIDSHALAQHITTPVLVVHDRDDDVVPVVHGSGLAARLPAGAFYGTAGLGHRDLLRAPQVVEAALAFIAAAVARGPGPLLQSGHVPRPEPDTQGVE